MIYYYYYYYYYYYTFKVLANQIISSEDLNKMEPNYIKCLLTNETQPLLDNLTKMYSKSSCEYECLVKTAVKECQCISWNTPELSLDNFSFCDYQNVDCVATMNSTFMQLTAIAPQIVKKRPSA